MHPFATRSSPNKFGWTSFDLHVLSTPPAFILSQDQTLQQKRGRPLDRQRVVSERTIRAGKAHVDDASLLIWPNLHRTKVEDGRYPCCCRQGVPTAKLTDSSVRSPEGGPTNCPHWRSVFSSVFKEPKLGHASRRSRLPCSACAGSWRWCQMPFRWAEALREAKINTTDSDSEAQPGS